MTRGLDGRVVCAIGGDPPRGSCRNGDLVATCTSEHSRNRTFEKPWSSVTSAPPVQIMTGRLVVEGASAVIGLASLVSR